MLTPLPPSGIEGTVRATVGDLARLTWWAERGFLWSTSSRNNHAVTRAYYAAASGAWFPLLPLALGAQLVRMTRPWVRYYLSPQRDAVIAVGTHRGCWYIEDHASASPGSGQGRALRAVVIPALCAAADEADVAVEAIALNERLARLYCNEVPGLIDLGRRTVRGRQLRRLPQRAS